MTEGQDQAAHNRRQRIVDETARRGGLGRWLKEADRFLTPMLVADEADAYNDEAEAADLEADEARNRTYGAWAGGATAAGSAAAPTDVDVAVELEGEADEPAEFSAWEGEVKEV
jgi:hypothetical protein